MASPAWEFTVLGGLVFGRLGASLTAADGRRRYVLDIGLAHQGYVTATLEVTIDRGAVSMTPSPETEAAVVRIPRRVGEALIEAVRARLRAESKA